MTFLHQKVHGRNIMDQILHSSLAAYGYRKIFLISVGKYMKHGCVTTEHSVLQIAGKATSSTTNNLHSSMSLCRQKALSGCHGPCTHDKHTLLHVQNKIYAASAKFAVLFTSLTAAPYNVGSVLYQINTTQHSVCTSNIKHDTCS